jgi:hypothetical protein
MMTTVSDTDDRPDVTRLRPPTDRFGMPAWMCGVDVPTPGDPAQVRIAFVEGIVDVARVDVDTESAEHVRRPHLDHGGMSGGMVSVTWWRDQGVPLLVARALARLPSTS